MLDVLPYLGSLGDEKLEVGGVPVALLVCGGYDTDQEAHFKQAAQTMIDQLTDMYSLQEGVL